MNELELLEGTLNIYPLNHDNLVKISEAHPVFSRPFEGHYDEYMQNIETIGDDIEYIQNVLTIQLKMPAIFFRDFLLNSYYNKKPIKLHNYFEERRVDIINERLKTLCYAMVLVNAYIVRPGGMKDFHKMGDIKIFIDEMLALLLKDMVLVKKKEFGFVDIKKLVFHYNHWQQICLKAPQELIAVFCRMSDDADMREEYGKFIEGVIVSNKREFSSYKNNVSYWENLCKISDNLSKRIFFDKEGRILHHKFKKWLEKIQNK